MNLVLIVHNQGRGYSELRFQLEKKSLSSNSNKIKSITILQDNAALIEKEPFNLYFMDLSETLTNSEDVASL